MDVIFYVPLPVISGCNLLITLKCLVHKTLFTYMFCMGMELLYHLFFSDDGAVCIFLYVPPTVSDCKSSVQHKWRHTHHLYTQNIIFILYDDWFGQCGHDHLIGWWFCICNICIFIWMSDRMMNITMCVESSLSMYTHITWRFFEVWKVFST